MNRISANRFSENPTFSFGANSLEAFRSSSQIEDSSGEGGLEARSRRDVEDIGEKKLEQENFYSNQ